MKNSKTDLRNKIKALKEIGSHIEEVKDQVILKIKQLKKLKTFLKKTCLILQTMLRRKKEHEADLGLFLELAKENKIICNQTPVNSLKEDMEKLKNGFFTNGYFSLGDDGEIDSDRFF